MTKTILRTMLAIARAYRPVITAILGIGITQTFVGMYSLVFFQRLLDGLPQARQLADLALPLAGYAGLTILNHLSQDCFYSPGGVR